MKGLSINAADKLINSMKGNLNLSILNIMRNIYKIYNRYSLYYSHFFFAQYYCNLQVLYYCAYCLRNMTYFMITACVESRNIDKFDLFIFRVTYTTQI